MIAPLIKSTGSKLAHWSLGDSSKNEITNNLDS